MNNFILTNIKISPVRQVYKSNFFIVEINNLNNVPKLIVN